MPRTPPLNLPENGSKSWYNYNLEKNLVEDFGLVRDQDLSPFTFSPSDEEDSSIKSPKKELSSQEKNNEETLYHKPASKQSTQQSSRYEIIDDEPHLEPLNSTQDDEPKFDHAIEGKFCCSLFYNTDKVH